MRVIWVGPDDDLPFVPKYAVLEDGSVIFKPGVPASEQPVGHRGIDPIELPEGAWLGVAGDGVVSPFLLKDEARWRAREAELAVDLAHAGVRRDPIAAAALIRGAAALVGLDMASFVRALDAQRLGGETLEQAFERLKKASG